MQYKLLDRYINLSKYSIYSNKKRNQNVILEISEHPADSRFLSQSRSWLGEPANHRAVLKSRVSENKPIIDQGIYWDTISYMYTI